MFTPWLNPLCHSCYQSGSWSVSQSVGRLISQSVDYSGGLLVSWDNPACRLYAWHHLVSYTISNAEMKDQLIVQLTDSSQELGAYGLIAQGPTRVDNLQLQTAGASLIEVYTALALEGPSLVPRMKQELADCLLRDGFSSVATAVGADHRKEHVRR